MDMEGYGVRVQWRIGIGGEGQRGQLGVRQRDIQSTPQPLRIGITRHFWGLLSP
jgi:hypothetical protein